MLGPAGFSGRTFWIIWLRRPRLKRAVHRVAVLTFISCSRVSCFMTGSPGSENIGFGDGLAEGRLEEIEVAALVGLLDVAAEHPAVAALVAGRWGRPGGAARGHLGVADLQVDGAGGHVHRDAVA